MKINPISKTNNYLPTIPSNFDKKNKINFKSFSVHSDNKKPNKSVLKITDNISFDIGDILLILCLPFLLYEGHQSSVNDKKLSDCVKRLEKILQKKNLM